MPPQLTEDDINDTPGEFKDAIYHWYQSTIISSAAPPSVRRIISGKQWEDEVQLSIKVVEDQIKRSEASRSARLNKKLSKHEAEMETLTSRFGMNPEADVKAAQSTLGSSEELRTFWESEPSVPYTSLCAATRAWAKDSGSKADRPSKKSRRNTTENPVFDVDEWIIRNERHLRENSHRFAWQVGLVKLFDHAGLVFSQSKLGKESREVHREPQSHVSGFTFLDDKRAEVVKIQPSLKSFETEFQSLSDGLLKGLDWSNVFVAGGLVLGSLLSVDSDQRKGFAHSDIDVYIYGLDAQQANEKISEIYKVWEGNLPTGTPTGVVRNSRTITFFAKYPLKRVQFVLKLVKDPREILLNFDLDIASMGWDGKELWLLPRAVRALETGYNTFTMNLVHGHFLGERRASQEARVFKYADRGYGIRILPSYIKALRKLPLKASKRSQGEALHTDLELEHISAEAADWVEVFLENEMDGPTISHAQMYQIMYKTTEPLGRDCLTSFERLMRHTHLWKEGIAGNVELDNTEFASSDYDERNSPLGYDDMPEKYKWDSSFSLEGMKAAIAQINRREKDWIEDDTSLEFLGLSDADMSLLSNVRRSSYGDSLEAVMSPDADMHLPILVPPGGKLVNYANKTLKKAFHDHNVSFTGDPLTLPFEKDGNKAGSEDDAEPEHEVDLTIALWRVSAVTAWQLIDRRIDEISEMLWSFHFGNATLLCSDQDRLCTFITHLSKRAIRDSSENEFERFVRWVGRQQPVRESWRDEWTWDEGGASGKPKVRQGTFQGNRTSNYDD